MVIVENLKPPFSTLDLDVLEEQREFITSPNEVLSNLKEGEMAFLIKLNEQEVGFFSLRPGMSDEIEQLRRRDSCTLWSFFIDSKFQGRGIAKEALGRILPLAKEYFPSVERIGLSVNCRNAAAYGLYAKAGFEDYGELYTSGPAGPQHVMFLT